MKTSDQVRTFRSDLLAAGFTHSGGPGQLVRQASPVRWLFVRTDFVDGRYQLTVYTRERGETGSRIGAHFMTVGHDTCLEDVRDALLHWDGGVSWPPYAEFRPTLRRL